MSWDEPKCRPEHTLSIKKFIRSPRPRYTSGCHFVPLLSAPVLICRTARRAPIDRGRTRSRARVLSSLHCQVTTAPQRLSPAMVPVLRCCKLLRRRTRLGALDCAFEPTHVWQGGALGKHRLTASVCILCLTGKFMALVSQIKSLVKPAGNTCCN